MRAALTVLVAWGTLAGNFVGASPAGAEEGLHYGDRVRLAPGVSYREFDYPASYGTARGHLLTVDLRDPRVRVDLLHPGAVTKRATVSALADAQGAVGAVNGDFFDISEAQHPGVDPTYAPVGPAIAGGRQLKAAVPDGQRFGPALPPGTSAQDVIGVSADRTARLGRLVLRGAVSTPQGRLRLSGLNQYALPAGGIGAFTSAWGSASRVRATCGTDTERGAPCSTDTYEVTVHDGKVGAVSDTPGRGAVRPGDVVLVGREAGARSLRRLATGDRVRVLARLAADGGTSFRFAVGGFPILRSDRPLSGLDTRTAATRTAAGFGSAGRVLYLLALDGDAETGSGLTISELAALMRGIGADSAVDLDGGGSSTLVSREPGDRRVTVRNHPSGGAQRPVPDAIGVFSS